MAKTRNWEGLSGSYRSRLERSGVTRADYESGASVTAARGHAKTPERPERAAKNAERYPEYVLKKVTGEDARRLARETKAIGKRYGIADEILAAVPPSQRGEYVAGWQIAHAEWIRSGKKPTPSNSYARSRLDKIESESPEMPKELGFYH
jgi:hypothetical protein